jgi:hypothetical protein
VLRDRVEREVRQTLGIPFNPSASAIRYEHSMGQGGLPQLLLRTTATTRRSTGEPVVEVEPQPTPVKVRRVGQAGAA